MNHHYTITMNHHEPPWFTNDFLCLKLAFLHLKVMIIGRRSFLIFFLRPIFRCGTVEFPCFLQLSQDAIEHCWISTFNLYLPLNFLHEGLLWCKMSPTVTRCFTKKWTRHYFLGERKSLLFPWLEEEFFLWLQKKGLGFWRYNIYASVYWKDTGHGSIENRDLPCWPATVV